jgi:hypothetical protein
VPGDRVCVAKPYGDQNESGTPRHHTSLGDANGVFLSSVVSVRAPL